MRPFYLFRSAGACTLLALLLLALRFPATAQAPAWQSARAVGAATAAFASNFAVVTATAVDAAGNVFLAGNFTNTVALGTTTLTSLGNYDVFVAKFSPATNQFVWAQRAGGADFDEAAALAVSGTSVYVTGHFNSPTAGFGAATLTSAGRNDVFVTKLTDTGSFVWAQRAGGPGDDEAHALAVRGTSVYVAGYFYGPTAAFGPTTLTNIGSADIFVAKLSDMGSTGSFAWAQRAGNFSDDRAVALAVSGTSVYVAGYVEGPAFFGTLTLPSAGSNDAFVAKLTDAGSTGSFVWVQGAGGPGSDEATALAVNGSGVYVAGGFAGPTASFGPTTLTSAGASDAFVAKLTDAGNTCSFVWVQGAGGPGSDVATALAVSGTGVYAAGGFTSPTASFGSTSLTNAGASDLFAVKLTDAGSAGRFDWAQQAGGAINEGAYALALGGSSLYVAGGFNSLVASFGPLSLTNPSVNTLGFLATLTDPTLTATTTSHALTSAQLYPNPAHHTATLRLPVDTVPAPLTLTDAQGRAVRQYPAPVGLNVTLDLRGLPAGFYLLRGAGYVRRLVVE